MNINVDQQQVRLTYLKIGNAYNKYTAKNRLKTQATRPIITSTHSQTPLNRKTGLDEKYTRLHEENNFRMIKTVQSLEITELKTIPYI